MKRNWNYVIGILNQIFAAMKQPSRKSFAVFCSVAVFEGKNRVTGIIVINHSSAGAMVGRPFSAAGQAKSLGADIEFKRITAGKTRGRL